MAKIIDGFPKIILLSGIYKISFEEWKSEYENENEEIINFQIYSLEHEISKLIKDKRQKMERDQEFYY